MALASDQSDNIYSDIPQYSFEPTNGSNKFEQEAQALLNKLPYKISTEAFYSSTDDQERDLLRFEVNCALQHFLEFDRPIYLEGLGLFIPSPQERERAYSSGQAFIVRKELVRTVIFEKCDDITGALAIYAAQGKKIVEIHELADRIYPRLPLAMHLKRSTQAIRSLLRAYLFSVRERLVTKGVSQFLSTLGTMYAMHNRQGTNAKDWYAGADILLHPRRAQLLQVISSSLWARPVFKTAWEPLEAMYGKPVSTLCLNLQKILNETGFALDVETKAGPHVEVAIFADKESRLIWCTEGLRKLAQGCSEAAVGSELIVQTPAKNGDLQGSVDRHMTIAARLLALGWAMLLSTRNKSLRPGLGINTEEPLVPGSKTVLTAAVATHVKNLSGKHLSDDGEFVYANITGISQKEARLISSGKRIHLLAMLELRKLDQVTQPRRNCIVEHTNLET